MFHSLIRAIHIRNLPISHSNNERLDIAIKKLEHCQQIHHIFVGCWMHHFNHTVNNIFDIFHSTMTNIFGQYSKLKWKKSTVPSTSLDNPQKRECIKDDFSKRKQKMLHFFAYIQCMNIRRQFVYELKWKYTLKFYFSFRDFFSISTVDFREYSWSQTNFFRSLFQQ